MFIFYFLFFIFFIFLSPLTPNSSGSIFRESDFLSIPPFVSSFSFLFKTSSSSPYNKQPTNSTLNRSSSLGILLSDFTRNLDLSSNLGFSSNSNSNSNSSPRKYSINSSHSHKARSGSSMNINNNTSGGANSNGNMLSKDLHSSISPVKSYEHMV